MKKIILYDPILELILVNLTTVTINRQIINNRVTLKLNNQLLLFVGYGINNSGFQTIYLNCVYVE